MSTLSHHQYILYGALDKVILLVLSSTIWSLNVSYSFNKQLQGIKIRGQPTIKALAFADDCVLAIHDSLDTKKFIKIYEVFSGISQAKINTDKTEVIKFGNSCLSIPWNTKPSKNPICHLGILISIYGFACDDMENNLL